MPLTYIYNDINEEFFFTQQMRVGGIPDAGSWEEPVPNFMNFHKPLLWYVISINVRSPLIFPLHFNLCLFLIFQFINFIVFSRSTY